MKNAIIISLLFSACLGPALAQNNDSLLINSLLKSITGTQVENTRYFIKGSFPSYRDCEGVPHHYQPDNNIFFTAISIFTLRLLLPRLTGENKNIASQIIENAQQAFPSYRNREGLPFYNFWPTGKGILPRTFFMKHFNHLLGMGEDADDAVMVLQASDANDSISGILKQRMIEVSNGKKKTIKSTVKKFRDIPAYSTYLGSKMPPDFDLGVHCNILYFMLSRKIPLVKQDSATIQLLTDIMKDRGYVRLPVFLSPYYARPPVLMYHLARLMAGFNIPVLEAYKPQLVEDMQRELKGSVDLLDRIILSTSLLRLGQRPASINISTIEFEKYNPRNFVFFQARAAFWYPAVLKGIFLHWSFLQYNFYCPAYNKVLWLEYLVERSVNHS